MPLPIGLRWRNLFIKTLPTSQQWSTVNWNELLCEINKCELICHNCHVKTHRKEYALRLQEILNYYQIKNNKDKVIKTIIKKEKPKCLDCGTQTKKNHSKRCAKCSRKNNCKNKRTPGLPNDAELAQMNEILSYKTIATQLKLEKV